MNDLESIDEDRSSLLELSHLPWVARNVQVFVEQEKIIVDGQMAHVLFKPTVSWTRRKMNSVTLFWLLTRRLRRYSELSTIV